MADMPCLAQLFPTTATCREQLARVALKMQSTVTHDVPGTPPKSTSRFHHFALRNQLNLRDDQPDLFERKSYSDHCSKLRRFRSCQDSCSDLSCTVPAGAGVWLAQSYRVARSDQSCTCLRCLQIRCEPLLGAIVHQNGRDGRKQDAKRARAGRAPHFKQQANFRSLGSPGTYGVGRSNVCGGKTLPQAA